ncbi:peptidyl-prolyl cis-trans isomerase [Novosphingobium ginsenosidimutans]|uniref:peptidylprolyl isomerase n=1 Tax=Novosphingobium ginsenosidimutans TaxID=1176536 RepID=A0A5B8S6Z9_9SPHN|nr:peptidylprolyl isomerase [Novosphingobium ginsenosidimutans]QEA17150.1 peptidyl-prolyl cis-trans isomerase [Novosphingobium ginsenosidimutans]
MTWRTRAAALLREPLVHFLVAGALIFVVLSGRAPDTGERRIVVDEAVVTGLVNNYVQAFRRPPSDDELDGLIRDYVRGEVYYREALRLGLDRDDDVVKKRLRNKMLAIAGAEAEATRPSDAELQALLDKDPARYAEPPRYTLEQRYLGSDTPSLRAAAIAQLSSLKPGDAPTLPEQPIPLPGTLDGAPLIDIATQFGDDFALALEKAPTGRWTGPVASGFGLHLVKVIRRDNPPPPKLADIRQRLENDWRSAAVRKAEEDNLNALLKGYDVVIEKPR